MLAARKKQSGFVSKSAILRSSQMKRMMKESASRAATQGSGAGARAKGSPTSPSKGGFLKRLWNRKTQ